MDTKILLAFILSAAGALLGIALKKSSKTWSKPIRCPHRMEPAEKWAGTIPVPVEKPSFSAGAEPKGEIDSELPPPVSDVSEVQNEPVADQELGIRPLECDAAAKDDEDGSDAKSDISSRREDEHEQIDNHERRYADSHKNADDCAGSEPEEKKSLFGQARNEQTAARTVPTPGHIRDQAQNHTSIDPVKRGGRPRTVPDDGPTAPRRQNHSAHAEVICWKSDRQWRVAVEIPAEVLSETGSGDVLQGGFTLSPCSEREDCWGLVELKGLIEVRRPNSRARHIIMDLGRDDCLLFQIPGEGRRGHRVRVPISGWHLVIAPNSWVRDEDRAGAPPVEPEPASITGYQAHFFFLHTSEAGSCIAFTEGSKPALVIHARAQRFALVGMQIEDAAEYGGPLFGVDLPRIRLLHGGAWDTVGTIVVLEETRNEVRWRKAFCPTPGSLEQSLPEELSRRGVGWFALRFYDLNDQLVESFDFRFAAGLTAIIIDPKVSWLPSLHGHPETSIRLAHGRTCSVELGAAPVAGQDISSDANGTTVRVPRSAGADHVLLFIRDRSQHVQVKVGVDRLWWGIGDEGREPDHWRDDVIPVPRQSFLATSEECLWLRLPRPRWAQEVYVGFGQPRVYQPKVFERTLKIPLRAFGDSDALQGAGTKRLFVGFVINGNEVGVPVCSVTLRACCRYCSFSDQELEVLFLHAAEKHLERVCPSLTYEELRKRDPALPAAIYQCKYCPAFVKENDPDNSTSMMLTHIEHECENVDRDHGPPRIAYRVVGDPDEIRMHVISSLPRIARCKFCPEFFENESAEGKMSHVRHSHEREIYYLE